MSAGFPESDTRTGTFCGRPRRRVAPLATLLCSSRCAKASDSCCSINVSGCALAFFVPEAHVLPSCFCSCVCFECACHVCPCDGLYPCTRKRSYAVSIASHLHIAM